MDVQAEMSLRWAHNIQFCASIVFVILVLNTCSVRRAKPGSLA